ncbi:MAG TPA: hypothetical protein VFB58_17055 [Chloroflexota bacterium]|nr:hypothetical protein [Chloroflexota bacterium]
MRRYLETFFQYWRFAVLPILIFPAAAIAGLVLMGGGYKAQANVWVNQSALKQLAYINIGFTPAQNLATNLSQMLGSPMFAGAVMQASPQYAAIAHHSQQWAAQDLHKNVTFTATGPNVVTVTYASNSPRALPVLTALLRQAPIQFAQLTHDPSATGVYRVVDSPAFVAASSKKQELLILGLGLLAGVLLSGLFVSIRTSMDHARVQLEDVGDMTGLPVLAAIPHGLGLHLGEEAV